MRSSIFLACLLLPAVVSAQLIYQQRTDIPVSESGNNLALAWAGGLNSAQFNAIDLNGDQQEDLVILDRTSNVITTFLRNGTSFEYSPDHKDLFPADITGWLLLRDFDCDGQKDVFTSTPFGIKVYRNLASAGTPLDPTSWELAADPILTDGFNPDINLQVNIQDIPGVEDLDGDGDLDILVYNFAIGGGIEYHQNLSIDNSGSCGLDFRRITRTWGDFEECVCGVFAFGESCSDLGTRVTHIGGKSILVFDNDGDGDKDLMIGEEQCEPFYFFENTGTAQDALFTSYSELYPDATNPIRFDIFPAGYYQDIDMDGTSDLVISPNAAIDLSPGLDFSNSVWVYRNNGTNQNPQFQFQQSDFLQDQMIETGSQAFPVFADYDRDGDDDMFIGNQSGTPDAGTIYLYRNTGSQDVPEFELETADYLGLSTLGLRSLKPAFGDLNGDNSPDLVFLGSDGTSSTLYFILNQDPLNEPFNLDIADLNSSAEIFGPIDNFALEMVDGDNRADVIIGRNLGRIEYYQNNGISSQLDLNLVNSSVLGIADNPARRGVGIFSGDIDGNGSVDLVTIDNSGITRLYSSYVANLSTSSEGEEILFNNQLLDETDPGNQGLQSTITFAGFGDSRPMLVLGTIGGGVRTFEFIGEDTGQEPPGEFILNVFPNPAGSQFDRNQITIESDRDAVLEVVSIMGKVMRKGISVDKDGFVELDLTGIPSGIYLVRAISDSGKTTGKRIVVFN